MNTLVLAAFSLFVLAISLRSQKQQDRIDWKSRIELLLLSTCICLIIAHWLHSSLQEAAESSASTGRSTHRTAMILATHYDPILMPIYIAITALLGDLLSRIARRILIARLSMDGRRAALWRTVCANVLVLVATPALLYAWTIAFATSGSMLSDASQDGVMPFIVAYAAPAHGLERMNDQELSGSDSLRHYSHSHSSGWALRARFWRDAAPWFALAVLLGCAASMRNKQADRRTFSEYFLVRTPSSGFVRSLLSTWRGIAVVCFTAAWFTYALISQLLLELVLGLPYIWLPLLLIIMLAVLIGIPVWIFNMLRSRRSKRSSL